MSTKETFANPMGVYALSTMAGRVERMRKECYLLAETLPTELNDSKGPLFLEVQYLASKLRSVEHVLWRAVAHAKS